MKLRSNIPFRYFQHWIVLAGILISPCLGLIGPHLVRAQAETAETQAPAPLAEKEDSFQVAAPSSTWYVATTGDDGNDCLSSISPCRTIQAAINKASSGDTVSVAEGTYQENLVAKDGVNLSGAGMFSTIVDAGGINKALYVPPFVTATIQQMAFTNSGTGYDEVYGMANAGVGLDMANITLTHCRIFNNHFFTGILSYYGINTFSNNLIDHNVGYGIFLSTETTAILQNNTIVSNASGGIAIHNIGAISATILNNILASNGGYGIDLPYGTGATFTIDYNDFWNNTSGGVIGSITLGTGNLSLDPKFRSSGSNDYSLLEDSPVINMGNPAAQYNDPDGSRNDMGAFPLTTDNFFYRMFLPLVIR